MVFRNKQYSVAEYFKQYVRVGNIMGNILSFGNGQLEGTITLENGNLLIDFIGKALVEKAPKEMNSLIKAYAFNIYKGTVAIQTNYGEEIIDISYLFRKNGYNYAEQVNIKGSKYVVKSVKEILTIIKSEFQNLKVGYFSIYENPWDSEIEYVIDPINNAEINIMDVFDRIINLQIKYSLWAGIIWVRLTEDQLKSNNLSRAGFDYDEWIKEVKEKTIWI